MPALWNAAALAAGLLSHILYFNRGEHHMYPVLYLATFLATAAALTTLFVQLLSYPLSLALSTTLTLSTCYLSACYASLLTYRIFFNPLNAFPGPFMAKISGLWMTLHTNKTDLYLKLDALHAKYGRYVRTGPTTLSIIDPAVVDAAFGKDPWRKSEWYDAAAPFDSMHTTRERALHDRRRKVWAPAFSDKALREYEGKVKVYNDKLVERLREFGGGVVNASKWFNLYSFDVMGQLAFGKNYGMLDSGETHWAIELLSRGMEAAPPRVPVWIIRLLINIPGALSDIFKFLKFCASELEWRVNNGGEEGDITGWILKAYKGTRAPASDPMYQGDARLIIVAGSDTTAAATTFLFYHLASQPEELQKLRAELRPLTDGKDDWSDVDIKNAPHLNGAINEALRMHPPVPSGIERLVPKEGARVGEVWLPGDASFWMPGYVMGRDERNYERALEFIPERWYSKPEMIKHKSAFAPFSQGSQGCIGKNLAYMEMRTLSTQLILNFDVELAPEKMGGICCSRPGTISPWGWEI